MLLTILFIYQHGERGNISIFRQERHITNNHKANRSKCDVANGLGNFARFSTRLCGVGGH